MSPFFCCRLYFIGCKNQLCRHIIFITFKGVELNIDIGCVGYFRVGCTFKHCVKYATAVSCVELTINIQITMYFKYVGCISTTGQQLGFLGNNHIAHNLISLNYATSPHQESSVCNNHIAVDCHCTFIIVIVTSSCPTIYSEIAVNCYICVGHNN